MRRRTRILLVLAAGAAAACGGAPEGPRWIELARAFEPAPVSPEGEAWDVPEAEPGAVLLRPGVGDALRLHARVAPEAWRAVAPGVWRAPRPVPLVAGVSESWDAPRLTAPGAKPLAHVDSVRTRALLHFERGELDPDVLLAALAEPPGPAFATAGEALFLVHLGGAAPADALEYSEALPRGQRRGGAWRVTVGPLVADGIAVLAGRPEWVVTDVPRGTALRFATAGDPGRYRVRIDGALVFEHERGAAAGDEPEHHVVALAAHAGPARRVTLELDGARGVGAFLTPVLSPAEVGAYGARPWGPTPPDLVWVLGDTFRADNLALHGGDPELAPHLNALARESVRFLAARSPASWTYPSHAAMFAGLYPHQAGATARASRLAEEAHTFAEHLAAAGYRTVAVTERGYVSRTFGLDQGFGWFVERETPIEETVQRFEALLDLDDGRPLFVFLHSYRAHKPYVVSPETRARLGARLGLRGDWEEASAIADAGGDVEEARARRLALYRGAAADFDAGFGLARAALERRGLLASGYLVFTSDHGEAFEEHGVNGHGTGVWEELIHVPLLVRGPGLEPREVAQPVSLVELPRTLSTLLGLEAGPRWLGRDLLAPLGVRPVFAFQCSTHGPPDRMAVVEGSQKAIALSDPDALAGGRLEFAYDLASDPGERADLGAQAPGWARELLVRSSRRALFEARLGEHAAELSAEQEDELRGLGYLGGD